MADIRLQTISALEKVFGDQPLRAATHDAATVPPGEVFSFQVAARDAARAPDADPPVYESATVRVAVAGDLPATVREVRSVPVEIPSIQHDPDLLRDRPGLYPDPLVPLGPGGFARLANGGWTAFWVTVRVPADCPAGRYPVTVSVADAGRGRDETHPPATATFNLEVRGRALPPQRLLRYEWLHADCLASHYRVAPWSAEHWRLVENFVRNAAEHGVNVLYTPLWTPPLDTAVGHERPTTQLLDIEYADGRYRFDFAKLRRYLSLGQDAGMTHFAMSHAFTQWGARATPKIVVRADGREEKRFGWHVASDDPAYADFLRQLMAELLPLLDGEGLSGKVFFSVSDEPSEAQLDTYGKAARLLASLLDGRPTLEALSNFEFHRRGLVTIPVPANNHIEPFVGHMAEPWTYYCVGQERAVPNRFMAMPSARVRIMGVLAYLYRLRGFLQWAYNFYYSMHSFDVVDPWRDTCAGRWVPAGDAFLVYPGDDGRPVDSLRGEVFRDGLQDLRALLALEENIGRDEVVRMIHDGLAYEIRMDRYPRTAEWLLGLRERVNRRLAALA